MLTTCFTEMSKYQLLLRNLSTISSKSSHNHVKYNYPVYKLRMLTCGNIYKHTKHLKIYRNSPDQGVEVDVEYVDTSSGNNQIPVIVALHDQPGSHQDFAELINYFQTRNCRVIVPNFPGIDTTKWKLCFWHSAEEKAQYVRDLLNLLKINHIDLLVCHSSGIYPGSFLWSESPTQTVVMRKRLNHYDYYANQINYVKSIALFNTPYPSFINPIHLTMTNLFALILSYSTIGRKLYLKKVNPNLIKNLLGFSNQTPEQVLISTFSLAFSRIESLDKRLKAIQQRKIPTMMLMSEDDDYDAKAFYFMGQKIGFDCQHETVYDIYDDELKLITEYNSNYNYHLLNIKPGDKYCHKKYSHVVNYYLERLLEKVNNTYNNTCDLEKKKLENIIQ